MGYFSAHVLNALQTRYATLNQTGHVSASFDAICGTSIGAILAAGMAARTPTEDIIRIMECHGPSVFPRRPIFPTLPGIFSARFRQGPLRGLLEDILGDIRLGELDKVLIIPAVNETRGTPIIFRSTDPTHWDLPLIDIALASAAAPLYLPLHRIGGERFTDGGLVANGPALLACSDLYRKFGVQPNRQRVISIGTTKVSAKSSVPAHRSDGWGGLRWIWGGGRLQSLLMDGQVALQNDLLDGLGPSRRLHLDMELTPADAAKVHLVRADEEARSTLKSAAGYRIDRITPEERDLLDRCLLRKGRKLAWQRDFNSNPRPVLVV